ncbi:hypothetical protein [Deinococcus detaillensis]|nr:hypothetical protein [Deinococcus detaillensis]
MPQQLRKWMLKPVLIKAGQLSGQPFTVTFQISRFIFNREASGRVRP